LPVGLTPREQVWGLNKIKLYRYVPRHDPDQLHAIPLLLVFAAINRPFLLDLRPGYSFVEFLLDEGFDVYLLDWGEPGPEDREMKFDDYGAEYLPRAVRHVLADSGSEELSILGYCHGGLVSLLYAALVPEGPLRNLILLTPPIDMSQREDSLLSAWFDKRWFDVNRFADGLDGVLSSSAIENGAKLLKAVANYVGAYVNLWNRIDDRESVGNWQAMHRWIHDGVPLPADVFRQWVQDYLWSNALVSGRHVVKGTVVDLKRITVPILNVLARYDHIVPNAQSLPVPDLVGSTDVQTEILPAGHIGIMAGSRARESLWPKVAAWLAARSGPAS
jgi:polyhydroxyalkanoate synthase